MYPLISEDLIFKINRLSTCLQRRDVLARIWKVEKAYQKGRRVLSDLSSATFAYCYQTRWELIAFQQDGNSLQQLLGEAACSDFEVALMPPSHPKDKQLD